MLLYIVASVSFDYHFQTENVDLYFTEDKPQYHELF